MIGLVISFIESHWRPFSVFFAFFIAGFADAATYLLFRSSMLSTRTIVLVAGMNLSILGYLFWLCLRPSFYIQPRSRAIAFVIASGVIGAAVALIGGI